MISILENLLAKPESFVFFPKQTRYVYLRWPFYFFLFIIKHSWTNSFDMSFRFERGKVVQRVKKSNVRTCFTYFVSERFLLKAKWTISQKCHCKNKLLFDQMIMMMAALYYINMVSQIFFYNASSLEKTRLSQILNKIGSNIE